jgi:aminopeptidase YwaD
MRTKRFILTVAILLVTNLTGFAQQAELDPSAAKLQQHVSYLASDALEGRRTGTAGASDAARYIAGEFARVGLVPGIGRANSRRGSQVMARYLQSFPYVAGVKLGNGNILSFGRLNTTEGSLQPNVDWLPLAFSENAKITGGIVYAGYGITSSELNYDDYAGLNATGKLAIALQGTPDGDNPHGQFMRFEGVRWKAIAARNAGAKALVVVARDEIFSNDRLTKLLYDNTAGEAGIPVVVISRQGIEKVLALSNTSLAQLEQSTKAKTPGSNKPLTGEIALATDVVRNAAPAVNVIGILEGSDPVLKNEHIVIGAHYDHLGRGGEGSGSLAPRSGDIHHGADDNASGTAGLIELARVFSEQRPRLKRTVIFIAFSGEEEGLLGSNYYVNQPVVPLANTVAMINMDMIGRMKDRKLVIGGVGTAKEWRDIVTQANSSQSMQVSANGQAAHGMPIVVSSNGTPVMTVNPRGAFELTLNEDGFGPSDHSSFYGKQVPVLFFWTGTHNDYHKPSDTFEKINYNDEARILKLIARIVRDVDGAEKRLTYTTAKSDATPRTGGFRVYLGTIPNYADSSDGLLIDGVRDDSPASKAGLKAGDRIVKIGTRDVKNVYDYTYALGEMKAGQEYVIEVKRGSEKLSLKLTPEARK